MIATQHWTAGVHHDGSIMYVSNPTPRADELVTIKLRVPLNSPIQAVFLRTAPDGESQLEEMEEIDRNGICCWYAMTLRVTMPVNTYRFKLMTAEGTYYYTAAGISRAEAPDALSNCWRTLIHHHGWMTRCFTRYFPTASTTVTASLHPLMARGNVAGIKCNNGTGDCRPYTDMKVEAWYFMVETYPALSRSLTI